MTEDKRNFIERSQSMAEKMNGREATIDEMATEFSKYKRDRRADSLDQIDAELASDEPVSFGTNAMRRLVNMHVHRRVLGDVHHALRKAGR